MTRQRSLVVLLGGTWLALAATTAACGSDDPNVADDFGGGGDTTASPGGSGGGSGGASDGGTGGVSLGGRTGSGGTSSGGTAGSSSGSGGFAFNGFGAFAGSAYAGSAAFTFDPTKNVQQEECVEATIESEEVFLDVFLILDRSGSMGVDCNVGDGGSSKWCNTINAIHDFFAQTTSVGLGISYGDFAFSNCAGFDPSLPFDVLTSGDENGHLAALEAALTAATPNSGTNTEAAVRTLISRTSAHQPSGSRRTIAVLVTDGDPYLTPTDATLPWQFQACASLADTTEDAHLGELNALLTSHFTATGIPTYVIGMTGATADRLDILATGAGAEPRVTGCAAGDSDATCSYYSVADGSGSAFQQAFESIRQSVVGCEYALDSDDVGAADIAGLEVTFTPDTAGTPTLLTQVSGAGSCAADSYYVDQSGPDPIVVLCDTVCASRGAEPTIDIQLTCAGQ